MGKVGFEDISVYCASKFGVMGLTESVAWEVGNYSIRVMTICPGEVATKMQELDDWLYPSKYEFPRIFSYRVGEKIFPPNGSRNRLVPNLVMPKVFS